MRCLELPKRITILLNPKENRYELYMFHTFAADPSCNSIYIKTLLFHYALHRYCSLLSAHTDIRINHFMSCKIVNYSKHF